jgi:dienelactone hydrolase
MKKINHRSQGIVLAVFFTLIGLQLLQGQISHLNIPDLVPVEESYLLSGKLDSSQYNYFLNGILKEQFDSRRKELAERLKSREALIIYLDKIKAEYRKLLGPFPEKTPLNPVVTGKIEREKYIVEKVAFESRPDHHVTALLYLPKGKGPFPAILHMPGHSYDAKGRGVYQTIGRFFALNGYVVLQVDPVCQGERCQICQNEPVVYTDINGNPLSQSTTSQHELYNEKLLLLGSTIVAWEAWDNIRGIDFLCSRSEVDITKIGITGLSGGGTQTTYLAPLDSRIKVSVPSSYIATTEEKFRTIGSQDGCQQLYSEGKSGIEEQDFLFMAAPMPVQILSTYDDFFSYKGSRTAVLELHKMYKVLGAGDRMRQYSAPGDHGMPQVSLEANVRWMNWWLKGDSSIIDADTLRNPFIPLKETYVTGTGQVLSFFEREKSVLDYAVEIMEQVRRTKSEFLANNTGYGISEKAAELTGYQKPDNIHGGSFKGTFEWEGLKIEKHLINRDRDLKLPALIIRPEKISGKGIPAIIFSGCFGKMNEISKNKQFILQKIREGFAVMVVDVSNTGELRTPESGVQVNYEFFVAKLPVYAGRTLLGYRTEDLVIARNYFQTILNINSKKTELFASEQVGPAAILAAVIDGGFSKLYLRNTLDSWETIVRTHFMPDNLGVIVPGVLKYYDLPDLELLLAGKKITVERIKTD